MLYPDEKPEEAANNIFRKYGTRAQEFIMFQIKRCQETGHPEQVNVWKAVAIHLRKISKINHHKK